MSNELSGRERLARMVIAERGRKYRTVDAARIAAGVNTATWKRVEDAEPVKSFSMAAIEEALGWPVGYAQRVIDGLDTELPDAELTFVEFVMTTDRLTEPERRRVLSLVDSYQDARAGRGLAAGGTVGQVGA